MNHFQYSCLSCLKPLKSSQDACDECNYINIETENLDERLFLLYFKYLEDKNLYIGSIRRDKLAGGSDFDFDASLQFLDDPEATGSLLAHYISKKYPDLFKEKSFSGIGFHATTKTLDEKNIETVKKNLLDPITQKIKDTYLLLDFLDEEIKILRSFLFLPVLYDVTSEMLKLTYTFHHISNAEFRVRVKNHKKTDGLEIKGLNQKTSRLEKLMVIKEKGFSLPVRSLAGFIYDLETAMGHIDKCELLKSQLPKGNGSSWIKLYENAEYNEKLTQLLSYKSHFPYLNRDHTKNFRNELNLQDIAETMRTCAGKSAELDLWIYLACAEVGINPNVEFVEADADKLSSDYGISLSLALDGNLDKKQQEMMSTSEAYQNLNWLVGKDAATVLNLPILSSKRLNIYQLEVFKHQLHSLTLAHRKFAFLELSEETQADMFRHFIGEDHPNKRLFERYETASKGIINAAFRLLFVVSGDDFLYDQILPRLKEPLVRKMEHENILRLLWQRKEVKLTDTLLKTINVRGEGALSHFIAGGPKNADKIPEGGKLQILGEAFEFLVAQGKNGALDIRPINRLCTIISNYQEKYPSAYFTMLYQMAVTSFTDLPRFKAR